MSPKPIYGKTRTAAVFYLNGRRHEVGADRAGMMLSDYLRYDRRLTGTKVVCAEGDCGACSVLRLFPYAAEANLYQPMNSCIATVAQMDGSSLVTVDALANGEELSPAQAAMLKSHGSQCGFCTPGFVVALTGLIEKKVCAGASEACTSAEAKNALTGNLCRCTGYQPIIDAATSVDLSNCPSLLKRFYSKEQAADLRAALRVPLVLEGETFEFYAPRTAKEAAKFLRKNPDARLVGATTDLGVVHNKGKIRLAKLVSLHLQEDLYRVKKSRSRLSVGARVTLTELRTATKECAPEFARFLDLFASPQIKNVATLVGNVGNASPIADTPPFLLVSDARARVVGPTGEREIPLVDFYLDYRKTALRAGELIIAIDFAVPGKSESLALYKASQRKDLDISTVNAAFRAEWTDAGRSKFRSIEIAFGGVAAVPMRARKTEAVLRGQPVSPALLRTACATLRTEMKPLSDLRGSAAFRQVLVENLLAKFFREHSAIGKAEAFQ
jgi:xanthine dehydrogenase small subunit